MALQEGVGAATPCGWTSWPVPRDTIVMDEEYVSLKGKITWSAFTIPNWLVLKLNSFILVCVCVCVWLTQVTQFSHAGSTHF